MQTPLSILKQYWHYDRFRVQQEEIIHHVLEGKDTLAILPTGGGKSVCYQVPALLMKGSCLVISPLIALMKDQSYGLQQRGIKSLVVHSGMNQDEVRWNYQQMSSGEFKFLFISPERLKSALFLDFLSDWNITLLTVDEAHCISQWGYDFRPAYLDIALIREALPKIPLIALTASATPFVQQDIIEKLKFSRYTTFFSTFTRPNLSFSSFEVESKIVKAIDILQKLKGSGLVYCRNRRHTKELSDSLNAAGLAADYYHAGLEPDERSIKQENWITNKTTIMVCTNAFGMGIDKADVRCVIHFDIPDTPEAYYQEAGRAGRDGSKSYAILLYLKRDLLDLKNGILLKYPEIQTIRNIYEALAYYFQVPLENGNESCYDFDVADFCKKFTFNIIEVLSSIHILEQQGYWTFNDSLYQPSKIAVTCSKQDIKNIEKLHPELDEVLTHVLRLYSGIWHHHIVVNELQVAQQARVGKDYVQLILRKLSSIGIVDYIEAKDKPQIIYLHDRVPKDQLVIDITLIQTLKKRYQERVTFMIDFAMQKTICRANRLISFFKEENQIPCGECDICLLNKQQLRQQENFESIRNNIFREIELSDSINIDLFCKKYSSLMQEQIMKTIRFLLDERKVELNVQGELIKKK